ncbi:MAG: sigma-70 family RNA polymerase sigma factor [Acidobacteria bacterium]|nr:sigma-70 family RNA polymerase sigma factor [Acidobacteriota bacterium]
MSFAQMDRMVARLVKEGKLNPASELAPVARQAEELFSDFSEARSTFVTHNLRLVVHMAKNFARARAPLADLIQAGNIGLLQAVDRFDPDHGARFSVYAGIWIARCILREIPTLTQSVKISDHQSERKRLVTAAVEHLTQELGRAPAIREISKRINLDEQKIHDALTADPKVVDLDAPRKSGEQRSLAESLPAEEEEAPQNVTIHKDLLRKLQGMVASLEPRLRSVLSLRHGLEGERPHTLREIGKRMGVSAERVRQIEGEATTLLRLRLTRGRMPRITSSASA